MRRLCGGIGRLADWLWVAGVALFLAPLALPHLGSVFWTGPTDRTSFATARMLALIVGLAVLEHGRARRTVLGVLVFYVLVFGGDILSAPFWHGLRSASWVGVAYLAVAFAAGLLLGYSGRVRDRVAAKGARGDSHPFRE